MKLLKHTRPAFLKGLSATSGFTDTIKPGQNFLPGLHLPERIISAELVLEFYDGLAYPHRAPLGVFCNIFYPLARQYFITIALRPSPRR